MNEKSGSKAPYHSRRKFCKVPAFLERGVAPEIVEWMLIGLVRSHGLGVVGWLDTIGDSGWKENGVWGGGWRLQESSWLAKTLGIWWQLLSLTGQSKVVSLRDSQNLSGKIGK